MKQIFTNKQASLLMEELAAVLEVLGDNPFKIRAYKNAAETISFLEEPLVEIWKRGELEKVKGIGKAISEKLSEIFLTGRSQEVESIKAKVPKAMFALLPIDGIGPKKAYRLTKEFGLEDPATVITDLENLIKENKIAQLEGFGEKSQEEILKNLKRFNPQKEVRMRIDQADAIADEVIDYLNKSKLIKKISALGSLRRRKSTIGDVDLGVATDKTKEVIAYLEAYPQIQQLIASGDELVRFVHKSGVNVDVKILDSKMWGSLLQHFTGSKLHNVELRELAIKKGFSLSEHGIKADGKTLTFEDEKDFYKFLGMGWIPPELRENNGEIQLALNQVVDELVELKDIKGDFHTHTNYDWPTSHDFGVNSPEELISQAVDLDYEYVGIGDHNPRKNEKDESLNTKLVHERVQKINKIAEKYKNKIKVFNVLETDILPDGNLALSQETVDLLDFALVSVHSSMSQSREVMTERILKALSYNKVKVFAHPTGRLINKRDGYEVYWDPIFEILKEKNIALEINANPQRLDISESLIKQAISQNISLMINTDSHAASQMDNMKYGISEARRGGAKAENIVNTYPLSKFEKWVNS